MHEGELARREIGDREIVVYPLSFGRARLGIGRVGDCAFADVW